LSAELRWVRWGRTAWTTRAGAYAPGGLVTGGASTHSTAPLRPAEAVRWAARARAVAAWGGRLVRAAPATLVLVALLWLTSLSAFWFGIGLPGRGAAIRLGDPLANPLALVTGLAGVPSLSARIFATAILMTAGVLAERRLGSRRYLLVGMVSQVVAVAATAIVGAVLGGVLPGLAHDIVASSHSGPVLFVVGAAFAASSLAPALWRKRFRWLSATLLATNVLYVGSASSVLLAVAAVVGVGFGLSRGCGNISPLGSVQEARTRVALVVIGASIGPLAASLTDTAAGPMSAVGELVAVDSAGALSCSDSSRACLQGLQLAQPPVGLVLLTCMPLVLALVTTRGLRAGRRIAWVVALGVHAGMAAGLFLDAVWGRSVGHGPPMGTVPTLSLLPALPPFVVVLLLWFTRGTFAVRTDRSAVRRFGVQVTAILLVAGVGYALLGSVARWQPNGGFWSLLLDVPGRLLPLEYWTPASAELFAGHLPISPTAKVLHGWVGVLVWTSVIIALAVVTRSDPAPDADTATARSILKRHGGGSLAWMGLWRGNSHWISAAGDGYVAYRVIGGVALTLGDPVGPADRLPAVAHEFVDFGQRRGWDVAFYSASHGLRQIMVDRQWEAVQVAEEALLDLSTLSFTGKRFQDIRTALNHAARDGVTTEWITYPRAPRDVRSQIQLLSEEWTGTKALPEMGFTLGGLTELEDPEVRCLVLRNASGRIDGVTSWLPIHHGGRITGWTLDMMRKRNDAFRPTIEVLIARAALDFKEQGYAVLSLSGAPLARSDGATREEPQPRTPSPTLVPPIVERLLDLVGRRMEPVYGFRSLLRFKVKFQPTLAPLYLVYTDAAVLPAVGRAVARAYVPHLGLRELQHVVRELGGRAGAS